MHAATHAVPVLFCRQQVLYTHAVYFLNHEMLGNPVLQLLGHVVLCKGLWLRIKDALRCMHVKECARTACEPGACPTITCTMQG